MNGGFALRFAVEVAFLALLALAAGLAELDALPIIGIMVAGWILVVLVEWLAWRSDQPEAVGTQAGEDDEEVRAAEVTAWDLDDIIAPVADDDREP
jgi:hypothetical protein